MDNNLKLKCSSDSSSRNQDSSLNLFDESDRLRTLADWLNPFANKRALAAAGFFYIHYENTGDLIKCPFCHLEINRSTWEDDADPIELHRRFSPICTYINRMKSKTVTEYMQSGSAQNSSSRNQDRSLNLFDESDRLRTLADWLNPFANKRALAAAGFFYIHYENTGDLIKCAFCHLEINRSTWEEDTDPIELHRRFSPICTYINRMKPKTITKCMQSGSAQKMNDFESKTQTIPSNNERQSLYQINSGSRPVFRNFVTFEDRLKTYETAKWPSNFKSQPDSLSEAGFFYLGPATKSACFQCGGVIMWEEADDAFVEHKHFFPKCFFITKCELFKATRELKDQIARVSQCTPSQSKHNSSLDTANLNLSLESERLKTFNHWHYSYIDKKELAEAGFYYIGKGDAVVCYVCKVGVINWERGDDPAAEHLKHSPNCVLAPFCRKILEKKTGCLEPLQSAPLFTGYDTCGLYDVPNQQPPKYPKYMTFEHRISSFINWPKQFQICPSTLWEAGFFYTGIDDHCICYHCGIGLKNWKQHDNPWTEHALWYPQCDYLVSVKGSAFVNDACHNRRDTMALSEEEIKDEVIRNHGCNIKNTVASSNQRAVDADENLDYNENDEKYRSLCKICIMNNLSKFLYPCGHVTCDSCAENLVNCPFCRNYISNRLPMYLN